MKKKIVSLLLVCCMLCSVLSINVSASTVDYTETIRALGIITGNENGEMNLSSSVTRAEFTKMMVAASAYKDSIGDGYGSSLFKDVKSNYWATEYIKVAVENKWLTGYVDGTFRPSNTITLEEACTALLRMLGYDSSTLVGSFPTAQLSKASSIGLSKDVTATRGQYLTRKDCVTLFYNLLTSKNSNDSVYATTLGYAVMNGEIDYASLISTDTKGPYIAQSNSIELPFSSQNITVYRNRNLSLLSEITQYDVYYYNSNIRTVWVYTDKVTGTITEVAPSTSAPTSITVTGNSYTIGSNTASYKLSSQGSFKQGDLVTLLLGMNGEVVDVISAQQYSTEYYGVVLSSAKQTVSSDKAGLRTAIKVICTDGTARTFYTDTTAPSDGTMVYITVSNGATSIKTLSSKNISGAVNNSGTKIGNYTFADNIAIIDIDDNLNYVKVYPNRIAGYSLGTTHVSYYALDENGNISHMILKNVTGDTFTYGYMTSSKESDSSSMNTSGSYEYIVNGITSKINTSNSSYNISSGGIAISYESGNTIKSMKNLKQISLTDLSSLFALSSKQKYLLDENVQVLIKSSSSDKTTYATTTLSAINTTDYYLYGWYDDFNYPAGNRIRIIIATER